MLRLFFIVCLLLLIINIFQSSGNQFPKVHKFPIVYVYTIVPAVCKYGLPSYIITTIEQALLSQPDCDIVLVSNFNDCQYINVSLSNLTKLVTIDSTIIRSKKTESFHNLSTEIFQMDYVNELWITSALRFFIMEDVMVFMNYTEMLHVEADNLIYGKISSILDILRKDYKGLAATPLTAKKYFVTASVLWVPNLSSLLDFNQYLYDIANNKTNYLEYVHWLRQYACCKHGGIDPDSNGYGIKPFAVNEMSMLGYYHVIKPKDLIFFPIVPRQDYILNRHVIDISAFSPGGIEVGPATGNGIWDPNSWGQFIGGTHSKRGNDKGFRDKTHIIGQAIGTTICEVKMLCDSIKYVPIEADQIKLMNSNGDNNYYYNTNITHRCLTRPHAKCTGGNEWIPLWNLHVHSKQTDLYRGHPCVC